MQDLKEKIRLSEAYGSKSTDSWLHWGPYLSERQWGTVREDYSADGDAWNYLPHDHARSRAYRWGEEGIAGISDAKQNLCFAISLWNGRDPILKERLFGLTNGQGNHGEDVKEYYYYLDNTPTHSYMKYLYKYPQAEYPYSDLVATNAARNPENPEYELIDTGVFDTDRYFDVQVEYAKAAVHDICIKITVTNHGPDAANLCVLPTLWFRNTWTWFPNATKPKLKVSNNANKDYSAIEANSTEERYSNMMLCCERAEELLFAENETNTQRLFKSPNETQYPKDGINDYVVHGSATICPEQEGTKASARYNLQLDSNESKVIRLRLCSKKLAKKALFDDYESTFSNRIQEADQFYEALQGTQISDDQKLIQRQAYAGMLWSKQFFNYDVNTWLKGDPAGPEPPKERLHGRNADWKHFSAADVLSMPDKWEYPWFATWDLCFHTVVLSRIDLDFAKNQLRILAHEWYMSSRGAIPAYEWNFSDVNPPLHMWAALKIFKIECAQRRANGDTDFEGDWTFLADIFRHCLMNFVWWLNQEDPENKNLFEGGFLGLDNISIINRSDMESFRRQINAKAVELNQSDGTSWVGLFCLNMMEAAIELCQYSSTEYIHMVTKFLEYFVTVSSSINGEGAALQSSSKHLSLWNDTDGFYYDFLKVTEWDDTEVLHQIKLKSLVGVIALFPVFTVDLQKLKNLGLFDAFVGRLNSLFAKKFDVLCDVLHCAEDASQNSSKRDEQMTLASLLDRDKCLLSFVSPSRLKRVLQRVLHEAEFLSPYGIRGISKEYTQPYELTINGENLSLQYQPAESHDGAFGGNSNWRGPVWFPINYMLIDQLKLYHGFLGDDFKVEYPSGSGEMYSLQDIADRLSNRLIRLFEKDEANQRRPVYGGNQTFQHGQTWQDLILFYEYFHGDNGAGIGASHQTGWTGLVAELIAEKSHISVTH